MTSSISIGSFSGDEGPYSESSLDFSQVDLIPTDHERSRSTWATNRKLSPLFVRQPSGSQASAPSPLVAQSTAGDPTSQPVVHFLRPSHLLTSTVVVPSLSGKEPHVSDPDQAGGRSMTHFPLLINKRGDLTLLQIPMGNHDGLRGIGVNSTFHRTLEKMLV